MVDMHQQLERAQEKLHKALQALAPKHVGGEVEEYEAAHQEVLRLERSIAAARGEEYAETIPVPVKWDTGAPLPQLLRNEHRTLLAFLLSEPDPDWDGTYVTVQDPGSPTAVPIGLVEFDFCLSAKLGTSSDEGLERHPLQGKGLEPYRAQRVVNSRWLQQIEALSPGTTQARYSWQQLHHYVFWFHDSTFECIARSFQVETHRLSMRALLNMMVERLIS